MNCKTNCCWIMTNIESVFVFCWWMARRWCITSSGSDGLKMNGFFLEDSTCVGAFISKPLSWLSGLSFVERLLSNTSFFGSECGYHYSQMRQPAESFQILGASDLCFIIVGNLSWCVWSMCEIFVSTSVSNSSKWISTSFSNRIIAKNTYYRTMKIHKLGNTTYERDLECCIVLYRGYHLLTWFELGWVEEN